MGMGGIILQLMKKRCAKDPLAKGCDKFGFKVPENNRGPVVGDGRAQIPVTPGGPGAPGDQTARQLDNMVTRYGVTPYEALQASNGRYNNPSDPAWWMTYGQGPEHQFFTNNSVAKPPGAGTPAPATGLPTSAPTTGNPQIPVGVSDPRVRIPTVPPRVQAHRRGGQITQLRHLLR